MAHSHDHGHVDTHGHHGPGEERILWLVLAFTLCFALVEAIGGWWAHSLTLLGDAGHMFSDTVAIAMAAVASRFSRRPPSARHSYGLARAEVVSALLNGLLMLVVIVGIVVEAIRRFREPQPVAGALVMTVAGFGLLFNVVVALILSRGEKTLNIRSALVHVAGDLLGSVSALIAGAVIYFTAWTRIDPILSILICVLILYSTLRLVREALHVLMEGVPPEVDLNRVGKALAEVPDVVSVHDLHIWMLSSGTPALSAHIVMNDLPAWPKVLSDMRALLAADYHIDHVTLQPETLPALQEVPLPRGAKVYPLKPENSQD